MVIGKQMFRYLINSGLSFGLNIGMTVFLAEIIQLPEEIAFLIALVVVFASNFLMLRYFVYEAKEKSLKNQFVHYFFSVTGFRILEYLSFLFFHTWLKFEYRVVAIVVLTISAIVKFFFYRLIFEQKKTRKSISTGSVE